MHHRKMSLSILPGDSKYADAHLMTSDGFIIPFHRIVFHIASEDRQLAGCEFELFINAQWRDTQVIPLPFPSLSALLTVHVLLDAHPSSFRCSDRLESSQLRLSRDVRR
jgi:hypothetical protein